MQELRYACCLPDFSLKLFPSMTWKSELTDFSTWWSSRSPIYFLFSFPVPFSTVYPPGFFKKYSKSILCSLIKNKYTCVEPKWFGTQFPFRATLPCEKDIGTGKSISAFPHMLETHGIIWLTLAETLRCVVLDNFTCCFSVTLVLNLFIP